MATISGLTACSGGDHITGNITLDGKQPKQFHTTMAEIRASVDETDKRAFIMRQVASLSRQFPDDTLVQFRNRVHAFTFME